MNIQQRVKATIDTNIVKSVPGTMLVCDVASLVDKILTNEAALGVVIIAPGHWSKWVDGAGYVSYTKYEPLIEKGESRL